MIIACRLFRKMAVPAQIVKLLLDQVGDCRVGVVAVEAHTDAGSVDEIVMALHAGLLHMIGMRKAHGQHVVDGMRDDLRVVVPVVEGFCAHKQQRKGGGQDR